MTLSAEKKDELRLALSSCKEYFIYAGVFSAAINILMLTPIIYMMSVYDRVVSSGSLSTLGVLTIIMVTLLIAAGGFEWVRSMILISASGRLEIILRNRTSEATFRNSLLSGGAVTSAQPMADLTSLRQFLTGKGLHAFFDAPWFPIYVGVMFLFHSWFGIAAIFAGIIMIILAYVNELSTNALMKEAASESAKASSRFQGTLRNAEVIAAMGMSKDLDRRQDEIYNSALSKQVESSQRAAVFSGISKSFRMIMQSLLLGLGAYLSLNQEISPGMMIAGSLLLGRALAPIDLLVGTWKQFSLARIQYNRLQKILNLSPKAREAIALPAPVGNLEAENISVVAPGTKSLIVRGVNFKLARGEALGIVGPSASGKSTLARALLGVWPCIAGRVRLDGADVADWNRDELGPHLGYLPQDIELFDGTIAENIARFKQVDDERIISAAKAAGIHEMILRQPHGYDTWIGGAGGLLSGGQRQSIGLARAIIGEPSFLVLDEPNSNLDDNGEKRLVEALTRIKARGCTIVVITHRTSILQNMDKILVMKEGAAINFGPKETILSGLKSTTSLPKVAS